MAKVLDTAELLCAAADVRQREIGLPAVRREIEEASDALVRAQARLADLLALTLGVEHRTTSCDEHLYSDFVAHEGEEVPPLADEILGEQDEGGEW